MPDDSPGVVPMISYHDGVAAMEWLATAFDFRERTRWLDDDGVLTHGEMEAGGALIMLATPTADYEGPGLHRSHCEQAAAWSRSPWVIDGVLVYVDDIVSHFERARATGARLLSDIEDGPSGARLYRAEDLEGHRWMFMGQGQ
jgi:PhnB protein